MSTYLICGLGNPGEEYEKTKHNIGFMAVEEVNKYFNGSGFAINKKFNSLVSEATINDNKVIIAKPLTFMNNSGQAVRAIIDYYKIPLENIIPIYDDIDMDFGVIRIRKSGGAGTHNGIKSLIQHLSSEEFPRIRLGIGQPHQQQDLRDYVLSRFGKSDEEKLQELLKKVPKILEEWMKNGLEIAMNRWNG